LKSYGEGSKEVLAVSLIIFFGSIKKLTLKKYYAIFYMKIKVVE